MPRGRKQSNIRNFNQSIIVDMIRKRSRSCNEIAKELEMSNSTVEYIVDELAGIGILEKDETSFKKSVGRCPIYYRLNKNFGMVVAVDLVNSRFTVCDACNNILCEKTFVSGGSFLTGHGYKRKDIDAIVKLVRDTIADPRFTDLPLQSIVVATFGKVEIETGRFTIVTSVDPSINLKQIFSDEFNVAVEVYNDIDLSAIAESECGKLKNETSNALYFCINEGCANTLFINGKIVHGAHYLSGEIGYLIEYSDFLKEYLSLNRLVTYHSIFNNAVKYSAEHGVKTSLNKNGNVGDVVSSFFAGDELCRSLVLDAARCVGRAVSGLINVLDCGTVVLSGNVLAFGEEYLSAIEKELYGHLSHSNSCKLLYSDLSDSALTGARIVACKLAVKSHLRKIQ